MDIKCQTIYHSRNVEYLREQFTKVYSNRQDTRIHTRKHIGIVSKVEDYKALEVICDK